MMLSRSLDPATVVFEVRIGVGLAGIVIDTYKQQIAFVMFQTFGVALAFDLAYGTLSSFPAQVASRSS